MEVPLKALGYLFATAALSAVVSAGSAATLYSTNFETDQSANFTVATSSADTEANFAFNYGTWTPTPTTDLTSITLAPNSTAGQTKALKMRANFDATGTNEGVTAYVNASAGLTSWSLTFDAFQMWNGPADVSGTGTTTGFVFGNAASTQAMYTGATSFNGWFLLFTGEGGQGASGDARYYSAAGAAPVVNLATPNFANNGGAALPNDMPGAAGNWDLIFNAANYPVAGTPGRQWVTWDLVAQSGTVKVYVTPKGGTKVQIANWAQSASQTLGLGFWDLNTGSVAVPPEDNFVLIDNLHLDTAPAVVTAADDWSMFQ